MEGRSHRVRESIRRSAAVLRSLLGSLSLIPHGSRIFRARVKCAKFRAGCREATAGWYDLPCKAFPVQPVSEAIRHARLRLLKDSLQPLGLAYIPFAHASL